MILAERAARQAAEARLADLDDAAEPGPMSVNHEGRWYKEAACAGLERVLAEYRQARHHQSEDTKRREDRLRQVHGMTREQQEALIAEARAARQPQQKERE